MLAQTDPFSIGTSVGLVIAGVLAALKVRRDRKASASGDTTDDKLDRLDRRLERIDERAVRGEAKLDRIERKVDRHIAEHSSPRRAS